MLGCHRELPAGSWGDPGAALGHSAPHTPRGGQGWPGLGNRQRRRHDTPSGSPLATPAHAQPAPISAGQGAASTNQRWAGRALFPSVPFGFLVAAPLLGNGGRRPWWLQAAARALRSAGLQLRPVSPSRPAACLWYRNVVRLRLGCLRGSSVLFFASAAF